MVGKQRGRSWRRAGAVLVGVGLLAGMAGCLRGWYDDSDAGATVSPTVSVSAESVGTAAPSRLLPDSVRTRLAPKPTVPPEGRKPTAAGAEAFVRYWLSLYSYTYNTNDQIPWTSVADAGCVFCESVVTKSSKQVEMGLHTVGGDLRPQYVIAAPDWSLEHTVVSADFIEEAATQIDERGRVVQRTKRRPLVGMFIGVRWDDLRGWLVVDARPEDAQP